MMRSKSTRLVSGILFALLWSVGASASPELGVAGFEAPAGIRGAADRAAATASGAPRAWGPWTMTFP